MAKFKVGDRVRVVKITSNPQKKKYIGAICTIKNIDPNGKNAYTVPHYQMREDSIMYIFLENELELISFTKSDLKDGMVIECHDTTRRMIMGDNISGHSTFVKLGDFTNTLEHKKFRELTIDKVYKSTATTLNDYFANKYLTLIWERPKEEPIKEMTVAEIEKELGYKVKIKSED